MSSRDPHGLRDYGGWRRRRGIGLFGLGAAGTVAVLGALLALVIAEPHQQPHRWRPNREPKHLAPPAT